MKKRVAEEQIIKILKEYEGGKSAVHIVREHDSECAKTGAGHLNYNEVFKGSRLYR